MKGKQQAGARRSWVELSMRHVTCLLHGFKFGSANRVVAAAASHPCDVQGSRNGAQQPDPVQELTTDVTETV